MITYAEDLLKTQQDIAALEIIAGRNRADPEKRIRLAYRQFHLASLSGSEADFKQVRECVDALLTEFGPKEDVCLLKANIDGRFHRLDGVKDALRMCPSLAGRAEGRSITADVDFQEGRYAQARENLESLIAERHAWDDLARLAHGKGKMGECDEADALYAEAEDELSAKEMRSFAWLELQRGVLALSRGQTVRARAHYERAQAAFPGSWHTDEHLAEVLAAEGRDDEAVTLLRSVVERAPKPELKQALGELLSHVGRADEARPWFEAAEAAYLASVTDGCVHYYHHLADYYADSGNRPEEAVHWARKDLALRANFSTQSALAWALFRAGDFSAGLAQIQPALDSGAQTAGIYLTASSLHQAAGDLTQGEFYAREAERVSPGGHRFHLHH